MHKLIIGLIIVAVLTVVVAAAGSSAPSATGPKSLSAVNAPTPTAEQVVDVMQKQRPEMFDQACRALKLATVGDAEDAFTAGYGEHNHPSAHAVFVELMARC